MEAFGHQSGTPVPRSTAPLLSLLASLLVPVPALAQAPTAMPLTDSAGAVAMACRVALALRPPAHRFRCNVERYQETVNEYVVRVHEQVPRGVPPLPFPRSEVRLSKREPSVTVTREPEL